MDSSVQLACTAIGAISLLSSASVTTAGFLAAVNAGNLISVDASNGNWIEIGPVGPGTKNLNGLAWDSNHSVLYAVDPGAQTLFTLDITTGDAKPVGPFGSFSNASGLEYDASTDTLWGCDPDSNRIFTINTSTGHVSAGVIVQGFTGLEGLAMNPANGLMYALADGQDKIIKVNPITGQAVALPGLLGSGIWRGLTFNPETNLLYATRVDSGAELFSINPLTGTATFIDQLSNTSIQGLAYVPCPSSLVCVMTIWIVARKRRRE